MAAGFFSGALRWLAGRFGKPSVTALPDAPKGWVAVPGSRAWAAGPENRVWAAVGGSRVWVAGDGQMGALVRNDIVKAPADEVTLYMDLGDVPEILAGASVTSCTVAVSPSGPTVVTPGTVNTGGYRVSTRITAGTDGSDYVVTFLATLNDSAATKVSRAATLKVRV